MTTFIKPYSFSDFVDRSWDMWKSFALHDAFEAARKIQLKVIEENEDASSYAYAGNVSNMPILWDADDYKFLSQFVPEDWPKALTWRYNEGLLLASEAREEHPEKSIENIKSEVPVLTINKDKNDTRNKGWREYYNVWTGMKELVRKLEAPHREHSEHMPQSYHPKLGPVPKAMGEQKPGPGLKDIDPWETDVSSPKHHSHYLNAGGGVYNYDLSDPVRVSDEDIDNIPINQIEVPSTIPADKIAEYIAKKKRAMKKNRHHTFAGFSVLQSGPTASKKIHDWRKAQGLGLLGDVGNTFTDPLTGKQLPVTYPTLDKTKGIWSSHAGPVRKDINRLKLPVITRTLNYKDFDKDGNEKGGKKATKNKPAVAAPVHHDVEMPVFMPGTTLPRIPSNGKFALTMAQREEFARRRGWWPSKAGKDCAGKYELGMSYEQAAEVCPAAFKAGAPGTITSLLANIDILAPEQIAFMREKQA